MYWGTLRFSHLHISCHPTVNTASEFVCVRVVYASKCECQTETRSDVERGCGTRAPHNVTRYKNSLTLLNTHPKKKTPTRVLCFLWNAFRIYSINSAGTRSSSGCGSGFSRGPNISDADDTRSLIMMLSHQQQRILYTFNSC